MDKEIKDIIYKGYKVKNQNEKKRYFSSKSILIPENEKPGDSSIWHMKHKPYK